MATIEVGPMEVVAMGEAAKHTPLEAELLAALKSVVKIADDAFESWDADQDMRVGKILRALSTPARNGYRADIDAIHDVIAKAEGR